LAAHLISPWCPAPFCSVLFRLFLYRAFAKWQSFLVISFVAFVCLSRSSKLFAFRRAERDSRKLSIFLEKFMAQRRTSREWPKKSLSKGGGIFPDLPTQSRVGKQKIILFYCCLAGA